MRDTSSRRARLDELRREMLEVWAAPVFDTDRFALIGAEMSLLTLDEIKMRELRRGQIIPSGIRMDIYPTSDQVAVAIIAAARETGGDPERVMTNLTSMRGMPRTEYQSMSHARAYAAMALRAVFDDCGSVAIARMVNAGTPDSYLSVLDSQLKHETLKWWDDAAFMRVVHAIEATLSEPQTQT